MKTGAIFQVMFPDVSGLALHQWNTMFIKIKIKKVHARGLKEMEVEIWAVHMTGAKFENQAHLQPLPLRGQATEQNSTNKDINSRMSSCVKLIIDSKTRKIFLDVQKVLAKTLSQCTISFADVDGLATAAGDAVG